MNKKVIKCPCPGRKQTSTQTKVVTQIRQYHGVVTNADKTIAEAGREQIRAAYKCGQLLEKERANVRSGHWGRFCNRCGLSEDTAGRYIKLSKSADLRDLIQKYRTLNMAYQGEGITSPQRQRITIKAINESAASTGAKAVVEHHNGGGNDGINLKAKVKGKDGTGASPAPESLPTPVLESKDPIARASIAKLTEAIIAKCEHESKPHQKLKNLLKWAFDAVPDRVLSEWLREYCTTAEMVDAIELILDDVKDIPEFLQGHVEALEPLKPWTEITSAPQQRITIKTINGSSANTGCEPTSKHRNGDGNDGINLKTKIKGGGNLGELINKVSPAARAAIESQLHPAGNGGLVQKANASIVAPVEDESSKPTSNPRLIDPLKLGGKEIAGFFQGPLLVDALLLQLKECSETKNPGEIDACVSYLKPIVKWYEKYAAK